MKRLVWILLFVFLISGTVSAKPPAPDRYKDNPPPPPPPPPASVSTYVNTYQELFPECDVHTLLINEVTTEYSDHTSSTSRSYSVVDVNGYTLFTNAESVEHLYKNYDHYFLVKINGSYKIVDTYGTMTSPQCYVSAVIIKPDRIKVSKNLSFLKAGYGIIDYAGNEIVPVKYQSIKSGTFNNGLYITKLNGYWGLMNLDNQIFFRNEYDSIKEFASAYLLKKEGMYGLADISGKLILDTKYDKIEKTGDYIIVKKGNLWAAYDGYGKALSTFKYKKIKLERNSLIGETNGSRFVIAQ